VPFFGDQFFFAKRIKQLKVGSWVSGRHGHINAKHLVRTITKVLKHPHMKENAYALSKRILSENGVEEGIKIVLAEYARFHHLDRWSVEKEIRSHEAKKRKGITYRSYWLFEKGMEKILPSP
jgi:hypothetical protein